MQASFIVKTKEMKVALSDMKRISSKFKKASVLRITVLQDKIEIHLPGVTKLLKAETEGLADILVPAMLLTGYLETTSNATIEFVFKQGELQSGSSVYSSSAIKLEQVDNISKNELPINPNRLSILRFAANKSKDEIERLNLKSTITYAQRRLNEKIQEAIECLQDYEVTYDEIYEIIQKKLKG